jgi:hypothetical protein
MIKYKEVQKTAQEIVSIKCDICSKVYEAGDFEVLEFHHVNFCGGYGSVFGDGTQVNCDICQHCLHKIIGDFCRCSDSTT